MLSFPFGRYNAMTESSARVEALCFSVDKFLSYMYLIFSIWLGKKFFDISELIKLPFP